ncbi:MAG: threonine synthase [Candidatus Dormibacteria bacterium]
MSVGLPDAGPTGSLLTHLEGALSGISYDSEALMGLDPVDSRPLLARYDLARARTVVTRDSMRARSQGGLWRWHELLPVRRWEAVATLGEGATPLLRAARLGSELGLARLTIKAESLNPTGSFKARGMAVAVSRAAELGAAQLVAPSAGNAGGALAAYAGVCGLPATVIMPADAPRANQVEVAVTGARLVLLDGLISDCGRLAGAIAQRTGAFDLSTLKEPYRIEGKKTMGFELAEDLDWALPDVIVYPTGGGTGLIGMWKAFDELEELGLIGAARPRMFSVQMAGCAPIVRAWEAGERFAAPWEGAVTRAAGMRVPAAVGDFLIIDCLRASGGGAVAVPESELEPMQRRVGALGGGYISLETAATFAALQMLAGNGDVLRDELVVVFDTGAGFKSDLPLDLSLPRPVPADPAAWDAILAGGEQG